MAANINKKNITPGTLKRMENEQKRQAQIKEKKDESTIHHFTDQAKQEILGTYKRVVIDSYLNTFTENYGDNFDYDSVAGSFKFNIKDLKNGLQPEFNFDTNNISFKTNMKKDFVNFNTNATPYFTKTNVTIDPDFMDRNGFNTAEEYMSYTKSGEQYDNLIDLEGQFIPTSVGERYGTFNKINKTKGFSTKQDSSNKATTKAKEIWSNMKDKVFSNVIKKFKL